MTVREGDSAKLNGLLQFTGTTVRTSFCVLQPEYHFVFNIRHFVSNIHNNVSIHIPIQIVVYLDQQMDASHKIRWSKSCYSHIYVPCIFTKVNTK